MKAVLCTHYGPPEELELRDVPEPEPGLGDVVVQVKALALNFFDTLIIAGKYQVMPPFPYSPGAEFAGIVVSIGDGVQGFKVGDRVLGHSTHGAAREQVAIAAKRLTKVPEGLDFDRAAGLTVIYGTALFALENRAQLKPGESVAVLGASGGVGLAGIEIGKVMGARVIACASSDEKVAFARQHGADEGVNYTSENVKEALRRLSGGTGVNIIFDPVGGPYAEPALRALDWGGRYLVLGFAAGEIPKVAFNWMLLKNCDVLGVAWEHWTERDPEGHRANMLKIVQWAAKGKLSAHVHARYPLSETPRALREFIDRRVMGKVILQP